MIPLDSQVSIERKLNDFSINDIKYIYDNTKWHGTDVRQGDIVTCSQMGETVTARAQRLTSVW